MSIYTTGNYSLERLELLGAQPGDIFEHVNFSQLVPHTSILSGISNLTFIQCNLVNCDLPGDAIINGGNSTQISRCSHLHPKWNMDQCVENCQHVVDTDEIIIDSVVVDTIYHYKDTIQ